MKKASLVMIVLWSVIGLIILAALITSIFTRRTVGELFMSNLDSNASLLVDTSVLADSFDEVKIQLAADECIISIVEDDSISVRHYGVNLPDSDYARLIENGSRLEITTQRKGYGLSIGRINRRSRVEIDLPANYQDKLNIDVMSGTVDVNGALDLNKLDVDVMSGTLRSDYEIKANDVDIDVASGILKLDGGLAAVRYDIELMSGNITVNEALSGSGKIHVTSGTMTLEGIDITDSLDIGVTSGTANIAIAGDPPLKFSGEKISGTINTYFDISKSGNTVSASVGEAPYKDLSVNVVSGTVRITQEK